MEVSDETRRLLRVSCMRSMSNELRRRVRSTYKLPKVEATRTPKVDPIIKSLASQQAKTADRDFARIQTLMLDSMAPLSSLLEQIVHDRVSVGDVKQATSTAVELIGNASAHVSHLRRRKWCNPLTSPYSLWSKTTLTLLKLPLICLVPIFPNGLKITWTR